VRERECSAGKEEAARGASIYHWSINKETE